MTAVVGHPARFSGSVIDAVRSWLDRESEARQWDRLRVLDCFAGVGGVHELHDNGGVETWGIELEPEWAVQHPRNVVANALNPPFAEGTFDVLFTSPSYANRMADLYDGRDGSRRRTYRLSLGRLPSPDSGAALQWTDAYRDLHHDIMAAILPVVKVDGLVVINMSNHIRGRIEMHVVEWWVSTLCGMGLRLLAVEPVGTPRFGFGANQQSKAATEFLLVFRNVVLSERCAAVMFDGGGGPVPAREGGDG